MLYELFVSYFENPVMRKWKNEENHSIYICRIKSLLMNDHRYILVYVPIDVYMNGAETRLSDLRWEVLQTRKFPDSLRMNYHSYTPKQQHPFNIPIQRIYKDDKISAYRTDQLPIEINLLADETIFYDYGDFGAVNAALETFNCIVRKLV
jgi:hypothetical protein